MPYTAVGDAMMIKRPICIPSFSNTVASGWRPARPRITKRQELISWGLYDIGQFLFHFRSLYDGMGTAGKNLSGSKQSTCLWLIS